MTSPASPRLLWLPALRYAPYVLLGLLAIFTTVLKR